MDYVVKTYIANSENLSSQANLPSHALGVFGLAILP